MEANIQYASHRPNHSTSAVVFAIPANISKDQDQ